MHTCTELHRCGRTRLFCPNGRASPVIWSISQKEPLGVMTLFANTIFPVELQKLLSNFSYCQFSNCVSFSKRKLKGHCSPPEIPVCTLACVWQLLVFLRWHISSTQSLSTPFVIKYQKLVPVTPVWQAWDYFPSYLQPCPQRPGSGPAVLRGSPRRASAVTYPQDHLGFCWHLLMDNPRGQLLVV